MPIKTNGSREYGLIWPQTNESSVQRLQAHRDEHAAIAKSAQKHVNRIVAEGRMTEENEDDVRTACWAIARCEVRNEDLNELVVNLNHVIVMDGVIYTRHTSSPLKGDV